MISIYYLNISKPPDIEIKWTSFSKMLSISVGTDLPLSMATAGLWQALPNVWPQSEINEAEAGICRDGLEIAEFGDCCLPDCWVNCLVVGNGLDFQEICA